MTFTYDASAIGTDGHDWVRFVTGDTDQATALWQDEEIAGMIARAGSPCRAAVDLLRMNIPRLAARSGLSRSIGDVSISHGDGGAEFWSGYADYLEAQCSAREDVPVEISFGPPGDTPRHPMFWLGQFDNVREGALHPPYVAWGRGLR